MSENIGLKSITDLKDCNFLHSKLSARLSLDRAAGNKDLLDDIW